MRWILIPALLFSLNALAGDSTKLYDPSANVQKDMAAVIAKAKKEKKHVLVIIGGNWCSWCYKFNAFVHNDTALNRLQESNFVVYHLNYSQENKNLDYLKKFGYPQRFGFPALIVLDAEGNRIHTQDSGLLEKGSSYDHEKVKSFFSNWSPAALSESLYKE